MFYQIDAIVLLCNYFSYFFFSTDILTKNLMTAAIAWDKKDNHNKRPCDRENLHVQALVSAINSCGVSFKIWEKKDANGSASGIFDFTSLMGTDKKLLLKNLPEKLQGVINAVGSTSVINLWKVIQHNEVRQISISLLSNI